MHDKTAVCAPLNTFSGLWELLKFGLVGKNSNFYIFLRELLLLLRNFGLAGSGLREDLCGTCLWVHGTERTEAKL